MNRIVLDTETTNTLEEPIAFDIGWVILDDSCEVIEKRSYIVAEIFLDKELMSVAYYADKIPTYWEEIENGKSRLARISTIAKALRKDCRDYEVTEIYAHNARFDDLSLKLTQRYLTGSRYRYFIPYAVKMCDTLKMSRQAFGKDNSYRKFCDTNGYKTAKNQNRLTAEVIYRFLTNDLTFNEVHQGIDDVMIEKEILKECLKRGVTEGALWE